MKKKLYWLYPVLALVAMSCTQYGNTARVDLSISRVGDSICVEATAVDTVTRTTVGPFTHCFDLSRDTVAVDTTLIVTGE